MPDLVWRKIWIMSPINNDDNKFIFTISYLLKIIKVFFKPYCFSLTYKREPARKNMPQSHIKAISDDIHFLKAE